MSLDELMALRPATLDSASIGAAIERAEKAKAEAQRQAETAEKERAASLLTASDAEVRATEKRAASARLAAERIEALLEALRRELEASIRREALDQMRQMGEELVGADAAWLARWQAEAGPAIAILSDLFAEADAIRKRDDALRRIVADAIRDGRMSEGAAELPALPSRAFFQTPEPMGDLAQLPSVAGELGRGVGWYPAEPPKRETWGPRQRELELRRAEAEEQEARRKAQIEEDERRLQELPDWQRRNAGIPAGSPAAPRRR